MPKLADSDKLKPRLIAAIRQVSSPARSDQCQRMSIPIFMWELKRRGSATARSPSPVSMVQRCVVPRRRPIRLACVRRARTLAGHLGHAARRGCVRAAPRSEAEFPHAAHPVPRCTQVGRPGRSRSACDAKAHPPTESMPAQHGGTVNRRQHQQTARLDVCRNQADLLVAGNHGRGRQ